MKIEHPRFIQIEENSLDTTDQNKTVQSPDAANNPVDSLEVHDGSDVFFGADDIFRLQTSKDAFGDPADGFQLQDAMKPRSQSIGVDLPQQFTDYTSSLQKAVNDALDGDAAAFQKVEQAFGFISDEKVFLERPISQSGKTEAAPQQNSAGSAVPDIFDIGIDPGDRLPDRDIPDFDTPDIPDEPDSSEPDAVPEYTPNDTAFVAGNANYPDVTGLPDDNEPASNSN